MNISRVNLRNFVSQWYGFIITRYIKGITKNLSARRLKKDVYFHNSLKRAYHFRKHYIVRLVHTIFRV